MLDNINAGNYQADIVQHLYQPCLIMCRVTIPDDHPLAAVTEEHVTQKLAQATVAVLAAAAEPCGPAATADGVAPTANGSGTHGDSGDAMDSDLPGSATAQQPQAAALLDQLCASASAAATNPEAQRALRALLCLLQRVPKLPAAARRCLAQQGLATALAAAGQLGCEGSGRGAGSSEGLRQDASQSVLCFLAVCSSDRCGCACICSCICVCVCICNCLSTRNSCPSMAVSCSISVVSCSNAGGARGICATLL